MDLPSCSSQTGHTHTRMTTPLFSNTSPHRQVCTKTTYTSPKHDLPSLWPVGARRPRCLHGPLRCPRKSICRRSGVGDSAFSRAEVGIATNVVQGFAVADAGLRPSKRRPFYPPLIHSQGSIAGLKAIKKGRMRCLVVYLPVFADHQFVLLVAVVTVSSPPMGNCRLVSAIRGRIGTEYVVHGASFESIGSSGVLGTRALLRERRGEGLRLDYAKHCQ